jgi:hypothetical protein
MTFEYRVIPAPRRGQKGKGVGSATEDRFAHALELVMNELGAEGWDYVRSDTLPVEERQGLTGRTTVYHTMLVFRRALAAPQGAEAPLPRIERAAPAAAPPLAAPLQLGQELPPARPLGPAERGE